jgi:hypothetical protein
MFVYNYSYLSACNLSIRNYGISEFQSSSSLQNSVNAITVPKGSRFSGKLVTDGGLYALPGLFGAGHNGVGIGFGKRSFPKDNKETKDYPSPSHYKIKTFVDINKDKGNKFAERFKFKKEFVNPGPGLYNFKSSWDQHQVSITPRRGMYYDENVKQFGSVSPQKYNPNTKPIENGRYAKIGIGYGKKYWDIMGNGKNPGVGSYNIPSSFDRSRKLKMPIN